MKKIDFTHQPSAKPSPFKVPEGYFENFTEQLMSKIPAETQVQQEEKQAPHIQMLTTPSVKQTEDKQQTAVASLFDRVKPYIYLAATICGLAFGIKVFHYQHQYYANKEQTATVQMTSQQSKQYVEDVCDFTMVDDNDVYACATEND